MAYTEPTEVSPEIQAAFDRAVAETKGLGTGKEVTPEDQERFLKGYSISALVFGPIYFQAMKDYPMMWYSILAAAIFFPIQFLIPFWARRRAWQRRHWYGFADFQANQKQWDKSGWYMAVVSVVIAYLLIRAVGSFIDSSLSSQGTNLQDTQDQLQELLNN